MEAYSRRRAGETDKGHAAVTWITTQENDVREEDADVAQALDVELHDVAPERRELAGLCADTHAVLDRRRARGRVPLAAFDLDETQPARAKRLEVVRGAELWSAAGRHGVAEQCRVAIVDQAERRSDPDRRVSADRRRRSPAALPLLRAGLIGFWEACD